MVRRLRQLSTGLTDGSYEGTQLEQQLSGLSPRVLSLAQQLFDVAEQELGITEHVRSPSTCVPDGGGLTVVVPDCQSLS